MYTSLQSNGKQTVKSFGQNSEVYVCFFIPLYEKNKFFHFSHFDLPKLYAAVLKMIHFMADNAESIEKTEFLTKQLENSNISYYISANTNLNTKRVKFCLEVNSQVFELPLTYSKPKIISCKKQYKN